MRLNADPTLDSTAVRRRFVEFRARQSASGDLPTIDVHAVAWGSLNSWGEVFVPGAFSDSLAAKSDRKPIVMGLYHELSIGKWSEYREDETGLFLSGTPSDTEDGRDAGTLVRDGALTGVSVGFYPLVWQYASPGERVSFQTPFGERSYTFEDYVFYILKADVVEASLVMAPADDEARVIEVRARALDAATRALPALRQAPEDISWEDAAYSMALLMGGRGAGQFRDLPVLERQEMYRRVAEAYQRHGKTPPDFTDQPDYGQVSFRHDEREVFTDLYLRKTLASAAAGAQGIQGPLSAETRQAAHEAVTSLQPLLADPQQEPSELVARMRAQLDSATRSLKETRS